MDAEKISIVKMLNNGHGLGRNSEGRSVFVPDAMEGETFLLENVVKRKGALWAVKARRLDESPMRQTSPVCSHFPQCGGCQMLHVRAESELEVKLGFLKDSLTRIGKLEDPQIEGQDFPMANSRIRGKFHVDTKGRLGFKQARGDKVAVVSKCLVIPDSVRDMMPQIQDFVTQSGFLGEIYFATDEAGLNPSLEMCGRLKKGLSASKLFKRLELPFRFVFKDEKGRVLHASPKSEIELSWNGRSARVNASSFFQSNPQSWSYFWRWTTRFIEENGLCTLWDAHSGSGFLISGVSASRVYCSEPHPAAFTELKRLYGHDSRFVLHRGTAESVISDGAFPLDELDGVILDPPRAGLTSSLRDWLKQDGPKSLLYFSCDMASFSRDLKDLGDAYELDGPIFAMNLNPGTLRLETICILKRRR